MTTFSRERGQNAFPPESQEHSDTARQVSDFSLYRVTARATHEAPACGLTISPQVERAR